MFILLRCHGDASIFMLGVWSENLVPLTRFFNITSDHPRVYSLFLSLQKS
jgi:hypothetical protein